MRAILQYLRAFFRAVPWPGYWALGGGYLLLAFSLNYTFALEDQYLDALQHQPAQIPVNVLFYGLPFVVGLMIHRRYQPALAAWHSRRFWLKAAALVLIYAIYSNFYYYLGPLEAFVPAETEYYFRRLSTRLLRPGLAVLLLLLFWYRWDRSHMPFYGLQAQHIDLRPYWFMLAIVLPLIVAASFTEAFQMEYPQYKIWHEVEYWGVSPWITYAIFEPIYGFGFFMIELFFRGALVLSLKDHLGEGVVLPMVLFYATIHFGKPMGEALGSVAGGLVLGVIALRTGSILGGIIIHLGVAYLMELAAIIQRYAIETS